MNDKTVKEFRGVDQILEGMPTTDGAGVNLTRLIATPTFDHLDPFLLLDEFKSDDSQDYIAGFPPHPHRGFETVTYMKEGAFRHEDSQGNTGYLRTGSVQWMTAGRGIIHSEMPEMQNGLLWGYQLWINLPARLKMTEPAYQDIDPDDIPAVEEEGEKVIVIAGDYKGTQGAAGTHIPITYLDVTLAPEREFLLDMPEDRNSFVYLYEGNAKFGPPQAEQEARAGQLVVLGTGEKIRIKSGPNTGFLLIGGQRIEEPIARSGPFVMNTREEIYQAFDDYQRGKLHTA